MPKPTLGIMALYLKGSQLEELSYFRKLSMAGSRLGLNVMVYTPEDVDGPNKEIRALVYDEERGVWNRKRSPFPDVVYDRCRYQNTYRFKLLRKFRADYPNLIYMSRPLRHKWGNHQILYKNKQIRPHLPDTVPYQSVKSLHGMLDKFDLLYVKPTDGTGGRGILRIEAAGNRVFRIQGRERSRRIIAPFSVPLNQLGSRLNRWNVIGRYLIQQGIDVKLSDGRVHDYRLLIQKNGSGKWEVTGVAGRIGPRRSITSNLHGGGEAVPSRKLLGMRFESESKIKGIEADMNRLAHAVAAHIENQFGSMCEMALDIAVDGAGKAWLLEINPKPSREVFHRIGEKSAYRKAILRPLEYALHLYKNASK